VKVHFEFSAIDLAEVGQRSTDRSQVVKNWRVEARIVWAVVASVLVFAFAGGRITNRVILATAVGVSTFVGISYCDRSSARRQRLLRYYREQLGGDGPFVCEVEISEIGLTTRQFGSEATRSWSQVATVAEVDGGIEFVYRPIGSLLVRDRAFENAEARKEFATLARTFVSGEGRREA
jgi:hypothetical protein